MNRPVCSFYSVGHVDATAIVSLVAIGAVIVIWSYLILATSFQGGISAWKRGLIYYISYRYEQKVLFVLEFLVF
jgi:hypothetical protein